MADNLTFYNVTTVLADINNSQSVTHPWILVAPEFVNLIFLIIGVYAMYNGIEICHPLYAVLFLNLVIALAATVINLFTFMVVHSEQYVRISNAMNGISIGFHCNCWCISSIIRYVYIIHDSWIETRTSNTKLECAAAIAITFVFSLTLLLPIFAYAFHLGKVFTFFSDLIVCIFTVFYYVCSNFICFLLF